MRAGSVAAVDLDDYRAAAARHRAYVERTFTEAAQAAAALPVDRSVGTTARRDLDEPALVWVYDEGWHPGELLSWALLGDQWHGDVKWTPGVGSTRRDRLHSDRIKPWAAVDESEVLG